MALFAFKEKDGTINMLLTGTVMREPELTKKGDTVKLSVAYGKKKYQNVQTWANSHAGRLAGCLEQGDHILAAGTWEQWEYDGKQYDTLRADFLEVQQDAPMEATMDDSRPNERTTATAQKAEDNPYSELEDAEPELPF